MCNMNRSNHTVNESKLQNNLGFQAARLALLLLSLLALDVSLNVNADERTNNRIYTNNMANNMRQQVEQTVMQYLQSQTQGYPGKVNIQLQPLDARIQVQACDQLEPFSMQGSRLWGKTHVGVRCRVSASQKPWSLYMQADVQVFGQYAVTAVPVSQGQVLSARDIVMQSGDLTRLPNGILTDANMVEGKLASINLTAGTVLRPELLKTTTVIQQGQTVQLSSAGEGFVVSTDGTAMNAAQPGQVVQVKVASGQTIKGIAKDIGKVEVSN